MLLHAAEIEKDEYRGKLCPGRYKLVLEHAG